MGRRQSIIRKYFHYLQSEVGKPIVVCSFCNTKYTTVNATKMKQHLESKCASCPPNVREEVSLHDITSSNSDYNQQAVKPPPAKPNPDMASMSAWFDMNSSDAQVKKGLGGRKRSKIRDYFHVYDNGTVKQSVCSFCNKKYTTINVTKMKQHLEAKCAECPQNVRERISMDMMGSGDMQCSTPPSSASSVSYINTHSNVPLKKLKTTSSTNLSGWFERMDPKEQENLNQMLSKAIFTSGFLLNSVDDPDWVKFFKALRPCFKPPTRNEILSKYLECEFAEMQTDICVILGGAESLNLKCDGWSQFRGNGIINFIVTTPNPVFVDFVEARDQIMNPSFVANEMKKMIESYGVEKFFSVIADNTSIMRSACALLKREYPHLVTTGCSAQTLNLLCGDIFKCETVKRLLRMAIGAIRTIRKSPPLNHLYCRIKRENNCEYSISLPMKLKWESYLRFLEGLRACMVSLHGLTLHTESNIVVPENVRVLFSDENGFWDRINQLENIVRRIIVWMKRLEAEDSAIHLVYEIFTDIHRALSDHLHLCKLTKEEEFNVLNKFVRRKGFAVGAIHMAAHMLNPMAQGQYLTLEHEMTAMEFIDELCISGSCNENVAMNDLASYRSKTGMWNRPFLWKHANNMLPATWWKGLIGNSVLSAVAFKILSAPATCAAHETTFSTLEWIHNKRKESKEKESPIPADVARKLTYVSHNYKLLHPSDGADKAASTNASSESNATKDDTPTYMELLNHRVSSTDEYVENGEPIDGVYLTYQNLDQSIIVMASESDGEYEADSDVDFMDEDD